MYGTVKLECRAESRVLDMKTKIMITPDPVKPYPSDFPDCDSCQFSYKLDATVSILHLKTKKGLTA